MKKKDKIIIILLLIYSQCAFRLLSFNYLIKKRRFTPFFLLKSLSHMPPAHIYKAIIRFSKRLNMNSCFIRSLSVSEVLSYAKINHELIIGAQFKKNRFSSHCWIEVQTQSLGREDDLSSYEIMYKQKR